MNTRATIGDNNPPDPIDEALAPYGDYIEEAQSWLDGEGIETEAQMKAVDTVLSQIKKAAVELGKAKKDATAPLYDIYKAEGDRWKPTEEDLKLTKEGLVKLVAPVKARLLEEREAQRREAARVAREAEEAAKKASMEADATNLEQQREAQAAIVAAEEARKAAQAASKGTVKGMRLTWMHQIDDMSKLVNWIAKNDKPAMKAFAEEYARRNHRETSMDGVRAWQEKVAV